MMCQELLRVVKERWVLICGLYFVALCTAFVFTRTIIGDESQLLHVGKAVYSGARLYRDAWFNQMPIGPYLYGAVQFVLGPSFYLGRFTSVALSVINFVLCVKTARTIAGPWGGKVAATLFAFNWVLANYYAAAYSPAMTGLLVTAAAYFLFKGDSLGCRLAALLCADLAVCTRALVFPITAAVNFYVLWARRDGRSLVLAVALFIPALFYLGFIHGQADHFLFANLYSNKQVVALPAQDQTDLDRSVASLPGPGRMLIKKMADTALRRNDFVDLIQYFPIAVLSVPLAFAWYWRRREADTGGTRWRDLPRYAPFLALSAGLAGFVVATILIVSYLLPGGVPNYQTPGYPLYIILCVYAYQAIVTTTPRIQAELRALVGVTVALAAFTYGVPNLAYASGVLNIPGKGLTLPLHAVKEVAVFIRDRSDPEDEILTDRPWFVYEAGRRPHLGFWMTWYSYAPRWSTALSEHYHVVNPEMIRKAIETRAPKFVIRYVDQNNESDPITFAAKHSDDPQGMARLFEERYERIAVFLGAGKHGDGAVIYQRRSDPQFGTSPA